MSSIQPSDEMPSNNKRRRETEEKQPVPTSTPLFKHKSKVKKEMKKHFYVLKKEDLSNIMEFFNYYKNSNYTEITIDGPILLGDFISAFQQIEKSNAKKFQKLNVRFTCTSLIKDEKVHYRGKTTVACSDIKNLFQFTHFLDLQIEAIPSKSEHASETLEVRVICTTKEQKKYTQKLINKGFLTGCLVD